MPDGSYNPEIVLAGSTASEMIIPSSDSDGSIAVAKVQGSTFNSEPLDQCIEESFKSLQFPKPKENFKKNNRPPPNQPETEEKEERRLRF